MTMVYQNDSYAIVTKSFLRMTDNNSKINAAPSGKQRQNGLAERTWRTILRMARGWIASSLLPPTFWWFAFKRAVEVSNYIPIKINNKITTLHELVFKQKPNLQNLLPMFSVAYVRRKKSDDDTKLKNIESHSIAVILVGRSQVSNSPIFFHPHTKKIITTDDYYLDETLPAGPAFDIAHNGGLHFSSYAQQNVYLKPPTFQPEQTVYAKLDEVYYKSTVITLPTKDNNIYTVLMEHDSSMHQIQEKDISDVDPYLEMTNNTSKNKFYPTWIKHDTPITVKVNGRYQHGYLQIVEYQYFFRPGKSSKNPSILLQDFESKILQQLRDMTIFKRHPPYKKINNYLKSRYIGNVIAQHVFAKGLTSADVTTLIQHKLLHRKDKKIWDSAYQEEYFGLTGLPALVTITEEQYQRIKHKTGRPLPTMAVSTIIHDENGDPKRAKYRIVILGHLDPNLWKKADTYAPVMSLIELRLFLSLAIHNRRILKSGDFKQAFCQATLPEDEQYVLRPPHGCPISKPNTYWLLKRTLYGLKRSARHWFDKATQILGNIRLTPLSNAPCIFKGLIVKNKAPLYLGLYVDDFTYFSTDETVEKEFEKQLKEQTLVDFMGPVTHFLGHKFQWQKYTTDNKDQLRVHISQGAYVDHLLDLAGLTDTCKPSTTPYHSGYPVDAIISKPPSQEQKVILKQRLRAMVGSMLWLSQGTRLDLSTITSMLAQYQNSPHQGYIDAAICAIRYINQTRHLGIIFDSNHLQNLYSYTHFPVDLLHALTDSNWGPQDQSHYSNHDLSPATLSSYMGHCTGKANAKPSLQEVQQKQRYTQLMNALENSHTSENYTQN